jgi:hypothetical protein
MTNPPPVSPADAWTGKELLGEIADSHRRMRDGLRSLLRPNDVPNCSCKFCLAYDTTLPTLEDLRGILASLADSPVGGKA